jgi:hypothetical protein
MNNYIGYNVNGQVFFNTYLAFYESFKSNKPIYFNCYDHAYDQLDWTQEPEQSFEQLMDHHAVTIRNRYERVVLLWSGGTDSHTIYNVFKRNNLHIDEVMVKHSSVNASYPDSHVAWLMENHWDPTTKITPFDEYDTKLRSIMIDNEDWVWKNEGDMLKFGHPAMSSHVTFMCEQSSKGAKFCVVTGYEKPSVTFENGQWYTRQSDRVLKQVMGYDSVENFFLDPVLHLKQSHMAKRTLKQRQANGDTTNWSNHQHNRNHGNDAYTEWATAIGRHAELSTGVSYFQKQLNITVLNDQLTKSGLSSEQYLVDKIKQQDPTALTYIRGLYNLQSEKSFYDYLNANVLESPDAVFKTRQIWSKAHCLGE